MSLFGDYLNLRPSGAFVAKAKGASSTTAPYSAINSPRRPVDAVAHQSFCVTVNAAIALMAGSIAAFLKAHPSWALIQRWLMGTVLAGLAVRMAVESRR